MAAAIPAVIQAAAAGFQAYGQYQQGKSQEAWHKYNSKVAEREGEAARQKAAFDSRRSREEGQRLRARQKALLAKTGVITEGTPLLVLAESAENEEYDRAIIEREGLLRGQKFQNQARLDRMAGRMSFKAGQYGATSSLLTGLSNVASAGASAAGSGGGGN